MYVSTCFTVHVTATPSDLAKIHAGIDKALYAEDTNEEALLNPSEELCTETFSEEHSEYTQEEYEDATTWEDVFFLDSGDGQMVSQVPLGEPVVLNLSGDAEWAYLGDNPDDDFDGED